MEILREEAKWTGNLIVMPPDKNRPVPQDTSLGTSQDKSQDISRDVPQNALQNPHQDAFQNLESIQKALQGCTKCRLHETRKNIVFGEGSPDARIIFIAEAPGANEDETGKPFVGRSGELITRIIENAMGLTRKEVYISNIVKCRPPGNRDPLPDEIDACIDVLNAQIDAIRPEMIIALGRVAAQNLLHTKKPISSLRGEFQTYHGIEMMPTFHPSYLLKNPGKKREVWQDIQKVMARLGLSRP